jgi:uncharacterized membrane protein YhaH (DUF805 family)
VSGILTILLQFGAWSSGNLVLDPGTGGISPIGIYNVAARAIDLANLWISIALSVKRLHDRDRSGAWVFLQILLLLVALTILVVAIAAPGADWAKILVWPIGIIALVFSVWLFVEMGFLRGTQGPNRFGPDPLGNLEADAKL